MKPYTVAFTALDDITGLVEVYTEVITAENAEEAMSRASALKRNPGDRFTTLSDDEGLIWSEADGWVVGTENR
jgi:hypothetical protein